MSRARLIADVAWWEFRRCWRLRDLVITFALSVLLALGWMAVLKLVGASDEEPIRLVVLDASSPPLELQLGPSVQVVPDEGRDEAALHDAIEAGTIDALLRIDGPARGRLDVTEPASWIEELGVALDATARAARLREAGLAPEALATLSAGFELDVRASEPRAPASTTAEKVAAGIMVGLMIMALFTGISYLFIFITGEKQQHVTEQVVSIISPQTWIDGKIAGLSIVALASMVTMVLGMVVWNVTLTIFGQGYDLTFGVVRPGLVLQLAALSALGFLLWFSFFGAIAATIDDPNTSSRALFMFVPALTLAVAFGCFVDPDSTIMRICAVLPPTAPSVLSARLVLTDVAWWELPLAMLLLVVAIWLTRRAAGKIFSLGILMRGTEPRWRDMARAIWSA